MLAVAVGAAGQGQHVLGTAAGQLLERSRASLPPGAPSSSLGSRKPLGRGSPSPHHIPLLGLWDCESCLKSRSIRGSQEGRSPQKSGIVLQDGFPDGSQVCKPRCQISPKPTLHTLLFFHRSDPRNPTEINPRKSQPQTLCSAGSQRQKRTHTRLEAAVGAAQGPPQPRVPLTSAEGGGASAWRRPCSSSVPLTGRRMPSSLGGQGL